MGSAFTCKKVPFLQPNVRYIITRDEFYQAFPCISTASDKRWGKKAWVLG